jgi:hypothetical protein
MDDLRKKILASARHLTAWQMARAMDRPGVDYRGCTKGRMAESLLERPNSVDGHCFEFRMARNAQRESGVLASDLEALEHRLVGARSVLQKHLEYQANEEAKRGRLCGLDNITGQHERTVEDLEQLIAEAKAKAE